VKGEPALFPEISAAATEVAEVLRDRGNAYGDPRKTFGNAAALLSAVTGAELKPADAASAHVAMKLARLKAGGDDSHRRDTLVDIAGYAILAIVLHDEQNAGIDKGATNESPGD